jgi:hypothetical protein
LILDEADMMCVIKSSGRDPADHLESWRLVALESNTVIVLLGTYRILSIWDRTSQFMRKMPTVPVRRYDENSEDDVRDFMSIVLDLCENFKVDEEQKELILAKGKSLMYSTGGIFGQLLALFERADQRAEASGRETLGLEDIRRELPRKRQIQKLWDEIAEGELRLESVDFEDVADVAKAAVASSLSRIRAVSAERVRAIAGLHGRTNSHKRGRKPRERMAVKS